jgi:hypothetical protein
MRGSPILRTLAVLVLLALTGLALAKLTRQQAGGRFPQPQEAVAPAANASLRGHYRLILSAEAAKVELESAGARHPEMEGTLDLDPANPAVALRISWAVSSPGHRFAKLILDLPGKDSFTHVFESPGDLDDIWELTP